MENRKLRLGNYFQDAKDRVCSVDIISESLDECKITAVSGALTTFPIKEIELNTHWFWRLGFEPVIGWDDQNYFVLPKDSQDNNRFQIFVTNQGFETPSGFIVKTVDMLQNAYFFHYLGEKEDLIIKNTWNNG